MAVSFQNENKRIAKNSIFLSIRMVIVLAINLYTTRAVLALLGVEDYGIYNVVCGFVSMFSFLNASMSNGVQRFFNYELGKNGFLGENRVYNMAMRIQLMLAILIIFFAETVGLWYLQHELIIPVVRSYAACFIYHMAVVSMLFIIIQVPFTAAVMAHEKMDFFALISVFDAVAKLAIVFITPCFSGDTLIIYGVLFTLISIIDFIVYYLYCKSNFKHLVIQRGFNKELFKSMLGFSSWNILGTTSGMLREQGINIIMNMFFGPVVNAARGVASQVNGGLQSFVANITIPVRPQVIQSYAVGDIDRTMNLTYAISKFSCLFLYFVSLPVLFEINFILKIWLGDNIPQHTSTFIIIVVMTSFLSNLNSAVSGVVHASGKMSLYQITGSFCGVFSVIFAYFILKYGGSPESALWVAFVFLALAQIVALLVLKRIVHYSLVDYFRKVLVPFFIVVVTTIYLPLLAHYFLGEGFIRFCVVLMLTTFGIGISTFFLGLDRSEKEVVLNIIRKIRHHK